MHKIAIFLAVLGVACLAAEYQFSTGIWDQAPTRGGSAGSWGEWFATSFLNDVGEDVNIIELGMPCCGPTSGTYGWVVWYDVGGLVAPSGPASTADSYGPYTPTDSGSTYPPTTYTYVDLSGEELTVEDGTYFAIGYDVTGRGGQVAYTGHLTWAWYSGQWDPDYDWGITALIQCRAETADIDPPYVDGMDPDDGEADVPLDSNIVFHCKDDLSGIDITTIDFKAQDTSLSGGRFVSPSVALSVTASPARSIAGHIDIDDSDLNDVVCTFDPTDDLPLDAITCTVDGALADRKGNELGDDFVWTFTTEGYNTVTDSTWGRIKSEF
ncbi:MAG: Ig-like domain-containing protein [bacterium]|nr:Ig-like domain-containing protein [bacterium]